jgi:succinoglycan biosynthesis protein ExoL
MATRVLFLLPVVSQARYHKRIGALEKLGVQPTILSFERDYYSGKPWATGYRSLGRLRHRSYSRRLLPIIRALPIVRAAAKESDAIYAFGLDTLLLGWLASRAIHKPVKIIYEVGDITELVITESWVSKIVRRLERYLVPRLDLLVATSEAYITEYYQGIQGLTDFRYQVIENKLDAGSVPQRSSPHLGQEWDGILRIGYFGVLRCRRSWEILKQAVERGEGRVRLYLRGILFGLEDLEKEIERTAYVDYRGPYVVPDDLPEMYGHVDIVWAAYPYQGSDIGNWRWARTNRFYEACFFGRPMLVQAGTQDGLVVETSGLGACLDLDRIEGSVGRILRIGEAELAQWKRNLSNLPSDTFIYSNEHELLFKAIH